MDISRNPEWSQISVPGIDGFTEMIQTGSLMPYDEWKKQKVLAIFYLYQ